MKERDGPMSTGTALVVLAVVGAAILAGGFLFEAGDSLDAVHPEAEFDYEFAQGDATLQITHVDGEALNGENAGVDVLVRDAESGDVLDRSWFSDGGHGIKPGDSITIVDPEIGHGDTVRVVWRETDAEGDSVTAVLAEFEIDTDER